jgi:acetolactate synthase I/II/III large subunit
MQTLADRIIRTLQCIGVQRLFGMPGGGSPADLIEAAWRGGLPFTLAQTETASAFMALGQAELTGKPGACIATLGPGAASIMNGIAQAYLDRAPLIVLTDCDVSPGGGSIGAKHQALDHRAMLSTLVKFTARPGPDELCETLHRLVDAVTSLPPGAVHLDLSADVTASPDTSSLPLLGTAPGRTDAAQESGPVRDLVRNARRPVLLVGLAARTPGVANAIRSFSERFHVPALVTYKAKGVVPDEHPWFGGVVTNGALEREVLTRADLFIGVGFDPVELVARPWTYSQPIVSLASWPMHQRVAPSIGAAVGDLCTLLRDLGAMLGSPFEWTEDEVRQLATTQRARMRPTPNADGGGLLPHRVVDLAVERYRGARITVDAGAHMFPVMSLWPAAAPGDVLISNGLSTMGFALPAGIGAALLDRSRPTVVFTGDGGLLMCLGELRTAARERLPLRVIVFDDRDLSLISVKQKQRGYHTDSTQMGSVDWASVGTGLGLVAKSVDNEASLAQCLRETEDVPGPVLIGARIDGREYEDSIKVLRG